MKKNTGKRTFQPCVRDCRVKPTAFRRGLATESLTVPQERPKEKESPEHSSGGHPSRHINYNTDSDHPCQSPFRPGKQGVNQSSLCFVCRFHICIQIRGAFHKQSYIILNLSPNFMASCCDISAQLDSGIVHFPLMSR